jgi:transcriptional regulator with XRE-family HTH domain
MFFENYEKFCKNRGLSPSTVAKEIGVGKGGYTAWKKGSEPTNPTKKRVADYFGITVEELDAGIIEKPAPTIEDELHMIDSELKALLRRCTPEDAQRVKDFVAGILASR